MTESRFSTILVPIDFSGCSLVGLRYGADLARALDGSLIVMVNVDLPEQEHLESLQVGEPHLLYGDELIEAAEDRLRHLADEHTGGVPYALRVTIIEPAHGILETAERDDVDMIVMSSHGRTGLTRWMLGSVADKIVHAASVPVIVVPAGETSPS